MRLDDAGRAGFAGLTTCGSVWLCPVCSARILARRQQEVATGVDAWIARGGRVAMLTLTMRHKRSDKLDDLWSALSAGWGSVTSGKAWQAEKRAHGFGGYLRVVETTRGAHGWHLHVHALLFLDAAPTDRALAAWKAAIFARWTRALGRNGLRPASLLAQDLHVVDDRHDALAGYFTKAADHGEAVALEFTQLASKQARSIIGGRTPWAILDGAIGTGDADELALWHEWEAASKGKRQMTWSRGLRDLLGLADELTDEQIADEELGDASDDRIELTADAWRALCRIPELAPLALDVLEAAGPRGTIDLLRSAGVSAEWIGTG
ncbi:protein rep [Pseudolysinimonas sp.]